MPTFAEAYNHVAMDAASFWSYTIKGMSKGQLKRVLVLGGRYNHVEYLSAPAGLIILAHQSDKTGQVDGIHPASLSSSIDRPQNIIEQLEGCQSETPYNIHWMTRRSQGWLVREAFGRMIHAGDPEAPSLSTNGQVALHFYSTASGFFVGLVEDGAHCVHVIKPCAINLDTKTAGGR